MGKKRDISKDEKLKIQCWLAENVKTPEIARRLGRAPSAVRKIVAKIKSLPTAESEKFEV